MKYHGCQTNKKQLKNELDKMPCAYAVITYIRRASCLIHNTRSPVSAGGDEPDNHKRVRAKTENNIPLLTKGVPRSHIEKMEQNHDEEPVQKTEQKNVHRM